MTQKGTEPVTDEAVRLARDIIADETWFTTLDPSMKDALSQPNHDHQQAQRAVALAIEVLNG